MTLILLQIAAGGAMGSVMRYGMVSAVAAPWGTAVVNVLGSLVMGILFVALAGRGTLPPFLMTGVLGGFTTFSAFSLDTLRLVEAGQPGQALIYVAASVALSLGAVMLGAALARGALA